MKVFAPAKVNLTLDIVGVRGDGYHLMKMVMQTIGLYDILYLERAAEGVRLECGVPYLPTDDRNLAVRAARAFFQYTGLWGGVEIRLKKQIPSGAGMGGGSADAAAVLAALNRLYDTEIPLGELCSLGETIGSDVPFCLHGGTALVEGIGELITPLRRLPHCWLVIVKPRASVNTKAAFTAFDQRKIVHRPDTKVMLMCVERRDLRGISREMANVFEETANLRELEIIKRQLCECGALGAIMTGSGSALFGMFDDRRKAASARIRFARGQYQAFMCEPVPHGPLIQPE